MLDTPEAIRFARFAGLRSALAMEAKGLRLSRRRSALAIAKGEGYRGNRARVLAAISADVARACGEAPPLRECVAGLPVRCPSCGALAVHAFTAERAARETDGTVAVCHPDAGGCGVGLAIASEGAK